MDQTNRILIVSGALLWIFIVLLIILLAWGAPDESIERIGDLAGYLDDHNDAAAKLIVTFGGLIFILLAAIVIIFEVAPPSTGSVRVSRVGAGEARIGTDEIALRLEEELRSVPHLTGIQAAVNARGAKAEVNLDLYVTADADLAATSDEACRRAREVVEERMGVVLDCEPHARVHYRELQVVRPEASPPPTERASATPPVAPPQFRAPPATALGNTPVVTESPHEASETAQEDRPAGA